MIILKLGGSLLTDKSKKFSIRTKVLRRVASEIKAGCREGLVIVHGGGSFGHPVARKYGLSGGFRKKSQLKGVAQTRAAMGRFNQIVVEALAESGISAVSLQPSANIICRGGRIKSFDTGILKKFVSLGITPVLYGDVVLDSKQGFCILSGDQIVSYLAKVFKPEKIILAADVDGLFDKNPKKYKSAKLVREVNQRNYKRILAGIKSSGDDVTGGIRGKVLELLNLANKGYESHIINGRIAGRLKKSLLGIEVIGTVIRSGNYKNDTLTEA